MIPMTKERQAHIDRLIRETHERIEAETMLTMGKALDDLIHELEIEIEEAEAAGDDDLVHDLEIELEELLAKHHS